MNAPQTLQQALELASQYLEAGQLPEAESLYRQILAQEPNSPSALHGLGVVALKAGNPAAAIDLMRRSIDISPGFPNTWSNLATAFRDANRMDEALAVLRQSAQRFPAHVPTFRDLGVTLALMGRHEESIAAYEQAMQLRAQQPPERSTPLERDIDSRVYVNIGAGLTALGRLDPAIAAFNKALEANPESATAHMNRGHLLFRRGQLPQAFADYEYRWQAGGFTAQWPDYPQPIWDGSDLGGKSVLLWHEQGMGDTIQFARYAPMVRQRNGVPIVWCQPALTRLLQTLDPSLRIVPSDQPLPPFDVHLPLLSLPRIFGTTRQTIPRAEGYLSADPSLVEQWRERLMQRTPAARLRVGLVWSGSTAFVDNANRSTTLQTLAPLFAIEGVQFFSIQKGEPAAQIAAAPQLWGLIDLQHELTDFAETAAVLKNLDLLITTDTGPAHLAGAIAAPVWTMLSFSPDFRWLWDDRRSSWYQSMRLFRQARPGDWNSVVSAIAAALDRRVHPRKGWTLRLPLTSPFIALEAQQQGAELHEAALISQSRGDAPGAIHLLSSAIDANPHEMSHRRALAMVHRDGGRLVAAANVLNEAISKCAFDSLVHRDLGHVFKIGGNNEMAVAEYRKAIQLRGEGALGWEDADTFLNLGVALVELGRHEEALAATDRAIELDPSNALARKNRVSMRFRAGDIRGGFEDYEWRWRDGTTPFPDFKEPLWDGSDLNGRRILLWHEQGFGDTIQFVRFIPQVVSRGGNVILKCQPHLSRLMRSVEGIEQVVPDDRPLPEFDVHAPLMGLPRLLGTTLENLPAPQRYLSADAGDVARWRDRLAGEAVGGNPPLRVGIVYAGSFLHPNDRNRSIPLEMLPPLLTVPDVRYYNLQVGASGQRLKQAHLKVVDYTPQINDFADTAALIENLDLVISVDTAVAHLAGALGKPVWLALPAEPEFRWLFETRQSRWYPSMRIYHQPAPGDWPAVIQKMQKDLRVQAGAAPKPVVRRQEDDPEITSLLKSGLAYHGAGQLDYAQTMYRRVLERRADHPTALHHLGLAAYQMQQFDQAQELMKRSVELEPTNPFFLKNFASTQRAAGNADEAARLLRRVIELTAPDPLVLEELGVTLESLNRLDESVATYEQAVRLLETSPVPLALTDMTRRRHFGAKLRANLAYALQRQDRYEESLAYLDRAIAIDPQYGMAHMHRANALFRRRDLSAAFAEYDWRFATRGFPTVWRNYSQPTWDGSELQGRTILLWPEQGLGDVIQFSRFAPLVAQRGGNVILQCMPPLHRVMETLEGVQVIGTDQQPPPFDVHLPLISTARALGITLATLPAPRKYLSADPALVEQWAQRIDISRPGLRVGIVWSGSPSFAMNYRRSVPLEALAPVIGVEGVRFFSLQTGEAAKRLAEVPLPAEMTDLSPDMHDFADTAAILTNLDLLISTDTATVHLAGALGKETWVMLWSDRDFRWLLDDRRTPWYPSLRLFLQQKTGDWKQVINRVTSDLQARAEGLPII